MELDFTLHPGQLEIFNSEKRFKVCAAGRRFGKSYLSAVTLLIEALKEENEFGYKLGPQIVTYYVAPTFQQGKDIMWKLIKGLGEGVIKDTLENTGVVKLINGREIHIKGSDRPDTLRGVGLSYVVLDEYATMKPSVWEEIIRPTLSDVKGGALFIGTPAGKNHFYNLFLTANKLDDWDSFEYNTADNPFVPEDEVENARNTLSSEVFLQEYQASFRSGGGNVFKEEWFDNIVEQEPEGQYYIAVDPAGFIDLRGRKITSKLARLDECAIAIVKAGPDGWYVKDIITGRWDVRETSIQILRAAQKYRPACVGIEKGSLKNAIMPYLTDQMRRLNTFPNVVEVTHGGKKKQERITWALQGRLEHGRVSFNKGKYLKKLIEQALDFPSQLTHDDMLDALAYIDQIAVTSYIDQPWVDTWSPLDKQAGY
jgi:hypothetical protein